MMHPHEPHDQIPPPDDAGEPAHIDGTELQEVNLSADLYKGKLGFKASIRPNEGSPQPKNWAEVGKSFNQSLMRIAAGLPGVVAEALDGAIRLCKGVASLPESIAERIRSAHLAVDRRETKRVEHSNSQTSGVSHASPIQRFVNAKEAEQALLDKIMQLQARGIPVQLQQRSDGVWVIVVVRPELTSTAHELGKEAIDEHQNPALTSGTSKLVEADREFEELLYKIPTELDRQIARLWMADRPFEAIGEELGMTADAVRARWNVVKGKLRDALKDKDRGRDLEEDKPE
ncbi:MAG: AsnC family protein [Phycisphaerales bacterium]